MSFIRSLVFKRHAYAVIVILLLGEIMPSYSYCKEKKMVYIAIIALFSYQLSFYSEYIKSNIYLSCNIRSVSNTKYIFISLSDIHGLF